MDRATKIIAFVVIDLSLTFAKREIDESFDLYAFKDDLAGQHAQMRTQTQVSSLLRTDAGGTRLFANDEDFHGKTPAENSTTCAGKICMAWDLKSLKVTPESLAGYEDVSEKHEVEPAKRKSFEKMVGTEISSYAFAYPHPPENKEGAFVYYDKADKVVAIKYIAGPGSGSKPHARKHGHAKDHPAWVLTGVKPKCEMRPITTSMLAVDDAEMFCWEPKCYFIEQDHADTAKGGKGKKHSGHHHKHGESSSEQKEIKNWKHHHALQVNSGCLVYQMTDGTYKSYGRECARVCVDPSVVDKKTNLKFHKLLSKMLSADHVDATNNSPNGKSAKARGRKSWTEFISNLWPTH